MMRFKPLPQIALTNLQPSFYDVESVTAIEMMAKFYSYLQDLVNNYNEFATEVNNEIDKFEQDINYRIDNFTCCIKKLVLDYIDSIDTKIALQDSAIADAVNYMQNNIIETSTTIINQAIDRGDLYISLDYDEPNESLNIIVSRDGE